MLLPGPPYASLTLLTAAPLSLSILVGGGLVLLPAPPLAHLQLRHPAVSVCPVVGGGKGGGVDTWSSMYTPYSDVSICYGGEGWCCD